MSISKFKLAIKFLFGGGVSGVVEYALEVLTNALQGLSDTSKNKIQAALNLTLKVMSILESVQVLVPTKWQTAYMNTLSAVNGCAIAMTDLQITKEELDDVANRVKVAYDAWKLPDDETCVTFKEVEA